MTVEYPQNIWTQQIEAVRRRNEARAVAEGHGTVQMAGSMPSARSAELGQPSEADRPLTIEERAELDRLALESGFVKGPVNPGIASAMANDTPYGSLEEAIAAGAPVGASEEQIAADAAQFRDPAPPTPRAIGARAPRQTAREFIAAQPTSQVPRLPDFKKVQMIDLVNGNVYVDGLEFPVGIDALKMLRKFAVQTAKEQIQRRLEEALSSLTEE